MLRFEVVGQELKRMDTDAIVQNSRGYLQARFSFSPDWDGLQKSVVLVNGKYTSAYMIVNGNVRIPDVFLTQPVLHLSAYGRNGAQVITTNIIDIELTDDGYTKPGAPGDSFADVYEEMRKKIQDLYDNYPSISVNDNTSSVYTLKIKSPGGEFVTPNLKGSDGGGTGGQFTITPDGDASMDGWSFRVNADGDAYV